VFCSPRCGAQVFAFLTLLLFSSCQKKSEGVRRLAILRFENLTGDDSLNWMGRAVAEVISGELVGSRTVAIISFSQIHRANRALGDRTLAAPGISAERPAALLAGAKAILYGRLSRNGSNLQLDGDLFGSSGKIEQVLSATGPEREGVIPLADSLAKHLAIPIQTYETQSEQALREYSIGLESVDLMAAGSAFSRAVAADPNFGLAYAAWAQAAASRNDRTEAERVLALASARGAALREIERARLAAFAAELHGDRAATTRSLEAVGRLDPADVPLFRQLHRIHLAAREYTEAAQSLKSALAVEPENPELWNDLGYAEMFAGHFNAAATALDEYRRIRPGDPNALDSLGDVNFYFGQFTAAEQYYRQSFDKDNSFNGGAPLMKAAYAHLRTGDVKGADAIFNQHLDNRRKDKDSLVEMRRAEWEFMTGRRQQALARAESWANSATALATNTAVQTDAQLAVWELQLGDHARARQFAGKAQTATPSPLAAVSAFLTQPPAPAAEWKRRAQQLLPRPEEERSRNLMLAYALLLQREFAAALPVLADVYHHSLPEPHETIPVLLGWAQLETGHIAEAERFLLRNPIPDSTPDLFASLTFPELLQLQAQLLDKNGRHEEALKARQLFLALGGSSIAPHPAGTR